MSADNGIYILKTKDQYRVAHVQGIEYIYDSIICKPLRKNKSIKRKCIPTRVVEIWGDCKFTRDELKAFNIAHNWASKLPVCEYGVNVITYNKTWKHILEDAQEYAKKEIDYINACMEYLDIHSWELSKLPILEKIANGVYLDEWKNRNKNKK